MARRKREDEPRWYVLVKKERRGPLGVQEIRDLLEDGQIDASTYVWRKGMTDWKRIGVVNDLLPSRRDTDEDPTSNPLASQAPWSVQERPPPKSPCPDPQPGESTRVVIMTAGIYRRRRTHAVAAVTGALAVVGLVVAVILDVTGNVAVPGMGAVFDATGIQDPHVDRALERVEGKLKSEALTAKEREVLQIEWVDLQEKTAQVETSPQSSRRQEASKPPPGSPEPLSAAEREVARSVYDDPRKHEKALFLETPAQIRASQLPSGLTAETLHDLIDANRTSLQLCAAQAFKQGERLSGKIELRILLHARGCVEEARVMTPRFRNSRVGSCMVKRIMRWRSPPFQGDPVPVVVPFVLSSRF